MKLSFLVGPCRVELGFSCFALLAFFCLFAGTAGGAFFMLAVLLHEGAHIAAMCAFGAFPGRVTVSALGCRIDLSRTESLTYIQSALVSLAGPACNLLCFFIAFPIAGINHPFSAASLTLGILHSLPIEPLDGGLALRSLLVQGFGGDRGGQIVLVLSLIFLFPMAVLGFLLLLRTRYNFSLLALSLYLMMYLVLKQDFFTA